MDIVDQVLSNETLNDKGYIVLSDGLQWDRYRKNPILLYDHDWSKPIGFVNNIRRDGANWVGKLNFDGVTDLSRETKGMYEAGTLRSVSIGGKAYYTEYEGVKYATRFDVYEISLVTIPSNEDAVSSRDGDDKIMAVQFSALESEAVDELSANQNQLITNYLKNMENKQTEQPAVQQTAEDVLSAQNPEAALGAVSAPAPERSEAPAEQSTEQSPAEDRKFENFASRVIDVIRSAFRSNVEAVAEAAADAAPAEEAAGETLSAHKPEEAPKPTPQMLNIEEAKSKTSTQTFKSNMEKMTVHEFLRTPAGRDKFSEVVRFSANREGLSAEKWANDSRIDLVREFVHFAANDRAFMAAMKDIAFTAPGTSNPYGTLGEACARMESFVSGLNSINFIETNPDLAKIEWSTMLYRELFPDDSWADRIPRISAEDSAGVIWINSAIKPKIYFGNRAPLNVAGETYDDVPVGIVMKLFALQNIIWQQANTDLLVYDDKALGMAESLRWLAFRAHNFYLQKLAEAASVKVPTTGDAFASANQFPDNTKAAGNIKKLTPNEFLALQTGFINQNFVMETFAAEMVYPAIMHQQIQENTQLVNLLTKNAGSMRPSFAEYSGFTMRPRSGTTLYDTASNKVVDPELYLDGKIQDNGSVPVYSAPGIAATAYSVGLGFIPSEAVIGIGRTNVHMVADPANYGWRMSMDMRTGAAAGRKGGLGIGLIYYAAEA